MSKRTLDSVAVGGVNAEAGIAGNERLEIYEYPGEYAKRFDGIPKGGGEQAAESAKIFPDEYPDRRDSHAGGDGGGAAD